MKGTPSLSEATLRGLTRLLEAGWTAEELAAYAPRLERMTPQGRGGAVANLTRVPRRGSVAGLRGLLWRTVATYLGAAPNLAWADACDAVRGLLEVCERARALAERMTPPAHEPRAASNSPEKAPGCPAGAPRGGGKAPPIPGDVSRVSGPYRPSDGHRRSPAGAPRGGEA